MRPTGDSRKDEILTTVAQQGFALVPDYLSAAECAEAIAAFDRVAADHPECLHWHEDDRLFGAEHVSAAARKFHDDPLWLELAEAYTGEAQNVFSTAANRITFDATAKLGSGGGWHRDGMTHELKVIVYLNDVALENGPFQILRRSHTDDAVLADMKAGGLSALQNRIEFGQVERILAADSDRRTPIPARAGTAIVFDTSSIHTGCPIQAGQRYALTNYILAKRLVGDALLAEYAPILTAPLAARDGEPAGPQAVG